MVDWQELTFVNSPTLLQTARSKPGPFIKREQVVQLTTGLSVIYKLAVENKREESE